MLLPRSLASAPYRTVLRNLTLALVFAGLLPYCAQAAQSSEYYNLDDFVTVEKIDAHVHLKTWETEFAERAKAIRMRFLSIAVHSSDPAEMHLRQETAYHQQKETPSQVAMIASFPLRGWDEPEWVDKTIDLIDRAKARGARGIKVWKDIGMEFRDAKGSLIMVNHPQLHPVIQHIAKNNMVLIGHLGEPKNCWLPIAEMTVKNDQSYFQRHPEYHMYLHPELPSYEDQIRARDALLVEHPNLRFIGAHFGSLEWSVDALAEFLNRFPKAFVDTAARMGQLQYQSRENHDRVRQFLIDYQDRIVYGTDTSLAAPVNAEASFQATVRRWRRDWRYFCTEEELSVPELDGPVKGLQLPRKVIDKIYSTNIRRLFPNAWSPSKE